MLSYYRGIPTALIRGGDLDGQIIYLDTDAKKIEEVEKELDEEEERMSKKPKKKLGGMEAIIYKRIVNGEMEQPRNERQLEKAKKEIKKELKSLIGRDLKLYDQGKFVPIPDLDGRINMFIPGPEGSGKSFLVELVAEQWLRMNENGEIFYFSEKKKDPLEENPIDRLEEYMIRVPMDIETLKNFPIERLKNNLCIFDDIDSYPKGKKGKLDIFDYIMKLIKYAIDIGRADRINIITTSHVLFGGHDTRTQILGARQIAIFPTHSQLPHINKYIKDYIGCDKITASKIKQSPRWLIHNIRVPKYVMNEKELILL